MLVGGLGRALVRLGFAACSLIELTIALLPLLFRILRHLGFLNVTIVRLLMDFRRVVAQLDNDH